MKNLAARSSKLTNKNSTQIVVLHIITGLFTGGAEMMLYHLLSKTDRKQFQPVVISLMNKGTLGDRIEDLNIPLYTLKLDLGKPSLTVIPKLSKIIREIEPNVIQGWMYHGNLAAQFASFFAKGKISVFWGIHHSINSLASEKKLTQLLIRLGAVTARQVEKIIFVSSQSKLQHEKLGYPVNKSSVIPNGFDTNLFQPSNYARQSLRSELNLAANAIIIGSIARYHPMKDHANFLKAAALLLSKISDRDDVHFVLIGTQVDEWNQTLVKLIKTLKLETRTHLLGERQDISQLTPGFDLMTSSSAFGEAFPLIIGEAMSCAIPCVVTDVGDSAQIVGNTGKVVPPKDAEALATAWQELILLPPSEKQALGKAAREKIQQLFSLQAIVSQYENLYYRATSKVH
ncbi:glycosyltransferase [Myxosarcina sp. GI1]|uniref:glycosyltransferase family 4 protein n=1 Tax=Myxosarcina sp. GI1 TaxID=1541065 RepID=UPI00068AAB57|nr:glycosyltransferase [Myxosarcina sp. GI1]